MATMAEAERTCDKCGRTFKSDGAWYAKHALKCDGTPATSGRIKTAERTPAATKRHPKPRRVVQRRKTKSKRVRLPARKAGRAAPQPKPTESRAELVGARDTLLAEMRAKRDLLNAGIAALEALA